MIFKSNVGQWVLALLLTGVLSPSILAQTVPSDAPSSDNYGNIGLTTFDLNGAWQASASGSNDWFAATVPGCIHTDLLAAGRIPDPFYRDNESRVQWVGEQSWTYRRTFQATEELCAREHLLLHCEGLDTFATVLVNGTPVGKVNNMFRTWEFDVKGLVKPGANSIEVQFASVLPFIRAKEMERDLPGWTYPGEAYVRKMPCNFGWDWGPTLITCGIWRNISLVAFDKARLQDVQILQDHSQPGKVRLSIQVSTTPTNYTPIIANIVLIGPDGVTQTATKCPIADGDAVANMTIHHPQLWWPAGMGAQPLYTVQVELIDGGGKLLDRTQKRIGLRTLHVLQGTNSTSMQFVVNGLPFFAKGANWIPADAFPNRLTKEKLRHYMADAAAANMNTLRFWGGGYYEDDALFDACDEFGICVWLDFKFGCGTYPAFDPAFVENVRAEATEQVKRLRHHPSIAVWCGNNEIMYFRGANEWTTNKMSAPDYYHLFRDTLGGVMRSLVPQSDYVTGSPDCGDVHSWDVWHGGKPFSAYRDIHGFISEFGFQSFPEPATVDAFTTAEDRTNVYSPVMKYHERSSRMYLGVDVDGAVGTDIMMSMLQLNFRAPKDFDSTLWLSQINQAYGIEGAAEGWRREMPRSMGCVYWQYNDDWPGTSWSSVDYFGRWKALQYRARHFYSPVLVSGEFNATNNTVSLWLTSDELKAVHGKLSWRLTDLAGAELATGKQNVTANARQSRCLSRLDLGKWVQQYGTTNLLVWLSFEEKNHPSLQNIVMLAAPKDLALPDPELTYEVSGAGTQFTVTVHARHPALWVWLELTGQNAHWSDNFVHIAGDTSQAFTVRLDQPMSKSDFLNALKVRSLYDTF